LQAAWTNVTENMVATKITNQPLTRLSRALVTPAADEPPECSIEVLSRISFLLRG
jgi:hypothetical protein